MRHQRAEEMVAPLCHSGICVSLASHFSALYFKDATVVLKHLLKAAKAVGLKTIAVEHEPECKFLMRRTAYGHMASTIALTS